MLQRLSRHHQSSSWANRVSVKDALFFLILTMLLVFPPSLQSPQIMAPTQMILESQQCKTIFFRSCHNILHTLTMTWKMLKHVRYNKDTKCWQLDYTKQKYISRIFIKEEDGKVITTQFLGAFTPLSRPC